MRMAFVATIALLVSSTAAASPVERLKLHDWLVPRAEAAISGKAAFVAVSPCRVVDTRGAVGTFGGPAYSAGQTRSFAIPSSACSGIPIAAAYSLNFTITGYDGSLGANGFITAFPTGTSRPAVSVLNFGNGDGAIANAAIVPASASGSIDVYSSGATNLIIDINGYFAEPAVTNVTAGAGINVTGTNTVTVSANFTPSGGLNGIATTVARGDHKHYASTIIVSPAGTDATVNGNALLAALSGLAPSAANPLLVKVEPGTYDIGTSSINMMPYMDLEGSGEQVTRIRRSTGNSVFTDATIIAAENSEIRSLTAESSGGSASFGTALAINGKTSATVLDATFIAFGGLLNNYGCYVSGGAPVLKNTTCTSAGGGSNTSIGVLIGTGSSATLLNVRATASGGGARSTGVYIVQNATSVPQLFDVIATGVGGSTDAIGVWAYESSAKLNRVVASGSGSLNNYGYRADGNNGQLGPLLVTIDHSKLSGPTATVQSRYAPLATKIGASQLDGGNMSVTAGSVTCIASYDENYLNAGGFTVCP